MRKGASFLAVFSPIPGTRSRSRATANGFSSRSSMIAIAFFSPIAPKPVIDGAIGDAEWGEPDFDGRFYRYGYFAHTAQSYLDQFAPERNRIWTKRHGNDSSHGGSPEF